MQSAQAVSRQEEMQFAELRQRNDELLAANVRFEQLYRDTKAECVRLRAIARHERAIGADIWVSAMNAIQAEIEAIARDPAVPDQVRARLQELATRCVG